MKIAVIAHLEHPIREPFVGGLEKHTKMVCDGLSERGHEVVLFGKKESRINGTIHPICNEFSITSLAEVNNSNKDFHEAYLSQHHAYFSSMLEILSDSSFDIIHNNSLHYLPISYCGILDTPMVSVLHTPPFKELSLAYELFKDAGPKHSTIAVSHKLSSLWSTCKKPEFVVHNGVEVPQEFPYKNVRNTLLWFGRIVPEKGTADALKAAIHAKIGLRVAGPICDRKYFEEEVRPLLDEKRRYIGHYDDNELKHELGQSVGVILTPKWDEPFGLVAAEALAHGVPVLTYDRGALREIITPDTGVLVQKDDWKALADQIPNLFQKNRFACWKRAKSKFSIEKMLTSYEKIYEEVICDDQKIRNLHSSRRERSYSTSIDPCTLPLQG